MRRYVNHLDQRSFVQSLNAHFTHLGKSGSFATAVVITFEAPDNQFILCNAGHPPPLILRAGSKRWIPLAEKSAVTRGPSNIPLGIEESEYYEQLNTRLKIGDLVLCYTDSLTESRDPSGELLGTEGVIDILSRVDCSNPAQIIPQLLEAFPSQNPTNLQTDDVTLLLFRPNGLRPYIPFLNRLKAPFNLLFSYFK